MKRFGIVLLATVGLASLAQAADLPTTKAPAAPPAELLGELLGLAEFVGQRLPDQRVGITLYGSLDLAAAYLSKASGTTRAPTSSITAFRRTPTRADGSLAYNGLSTTVLGLR